MFHGQFKSTVACSKCPRVSVTFDPMMTIMLPIPGKKETVKFYYVPYDITYGYMNKISEVTLRGTSSWMEFREQVEKKYGINKSSFTITKVSDNSYKQFYSCNQTVEEYTAKNVMGKVDGVLLLYEIDPRLQPELPVKPDHTDSNNGIDAQFTRLIINFSYLEKPSMRSVSLNTKNQLPRIFWVKKNWDLKTLHLQVFSYFRHIFIEWLDLNDPESEKAKKTPNAK